MTASGQDSAPRNSLRGSPRGTGEWHIYTAIYDERKSEMFVDGYCEASAKNVGNNKLDGLSIGCDHNRRSVTWATRSLCGARPCCR